MRCAVCARRAPEVVRWATVGGVDYGMACRGECAGLLWEAHFLQSTSATEFEFALMLWRWKRRRAEVVGQPFTEPPPQSPLERRCAAQQAAALLGVAA